MAALTSKQRSHLPFSEIMRERYFSPLTASIIAHSSHWAEANWLSQHLAKQRILNWTKGMSGRGPAPWRTTRNFCRCWRHSFRIVLDIHKSRRDVSPNRLYTIHRKAPNLCLFWRSLRPLRVRPQRIGVISPLLCTAMKWKFMDFSFFQAALKQANCDFPLCLPGINAAGKIHGCETVSASRRW